MDNDFNDFWSAYRPDEIRFPHRKAATYNEWLKRSPAARRAMIDQLKTEGAPKWKNPFFFVQDFPEPEPTNYNGQRTMPKDTPLVTAKYNGRYGIYTAAEAQLFGMTDIKNYHP